MTDERRGRIVLVMGSGLSSRPEIAAALELMHRHEEVILVSHAESPRELYLALEQLDGIALRELVGRRAPPMPLVLEALVAELPPLPVLASAPRSGPARDPRAKQHEARARQVLRGRGRRP